jgi:hypothetical protein
MEIVNANLVTHFYTTDLYSLTLKSKIFTYIILIFFFSIKIVQSIASFTQTLPLTFSLLTLFAALKFPL